MERVSDGGCGRGDCAKTEAQEGFQPPAAAVESNNPVNHGLICLQWSRERGFWGRVSVAVAESAKRQRRGGERQMGAGERAGGRGRWEQ